MTDAPVEDSRARIVRVARDLFVERGYRRTSLQRIADRLGLTKAAVLYHFPSKAHILAALAEPLLDDLEAALDPAERTGGAAAPRIALEGHLDALLAHRQMLRMLSHDFALLAQEDAGQRFYQVAHRANAVVAGLDAEPEDRVRAAQAIAMLSDPVVPFADAPTGWLRERILDGVRRLLGDDLWSTAGARRPAVPEVRRVGRPGVMDDTMTATAQGMRASGSSVSDIANTLGVSRATVYRRLSAAPTTSDDDHNLSQN